MDEQKELENEWRERLEAAEKQYDRARAETEAALDACDCNATSAEIELLRQTRSRETAALDEYMRVLRIFHELVVGRKPPA